MFAPRRVPPLLDLLGGGVEDAQEGHRAGGHAAGRPTREFLGRRRKRRSPCRRRTCGSWRRILRRRKFLRWSRRRGARSRPKAGRARSPRSSAWANWAGSANRSSCRRRRGPARRVSTGTVRIWLPRRLWRTLRARRARSRPRRIGRSRPCGNSVWKGLFRIGIDDGGVRLRGIFIMVAPALFGVLTGSPRYAVGKEKAISGNGAGTGTTAHFWKNRQEKNFLWKNAMLDSRLPQRAKSPLRRPSGVEARSC